MDPYSTPPHKNHNVPIIHCSNKMTEITKFVTDIFEASGITAKFKNMVAVVLTYMFGLLVSLRVFDTLCGPILYQSSHMFEIIRNHFEKLPNRTTSSGFKRGREVISKFTQRMLNT